MKEIIESIQKNLYKLSNILSTPNVIKVLENNSIDISNLKTNFDIDKIDNIKYLDNLVLDILNEKLEFFIKYSKNEFDIKHNKLELSVCLNFIENQLINNLDKNQDSKNIINTAYLKSIKIKNYFSIKDIDIKDLNSKEIYFIGENGEGKTILLQAILLALKGKKYLKMEYIEDSLKNQIELYSKIDKEYIKYLDVKNIFAYGINRNKIDYKNFDKNGYDGLFDTSDIRKTTLLKDPIKVLEYNHILIDDFIEKLNIIIFEEKVKVIKKDKEIIFNENGYNIEFDKLSEGYKSTIIWLSDLISRFIENQQNIKKIDDFKAIVLVDEIDLYLHPKLKYDFIYRLRKVFKGIQFIVTTHSLVSILGASKDALFYKVYKENNKTKISEKIDDISYYTSDILMSSPLFNLDSVTARNYKGKISSDDYVYDKIHKKIKSKLKDEKIVKNNEIDNWIDEEFSKEFGD